MKIHCKNVSTVLYSEGDILNMKIPTESVKNLLFIQVLSVLTNPVPDKDQFVIKIWQGKEGTRKDIKGLFQARNCSGPGTIFQPCGRLAQCDIRPYSSSTLSPKPDWPHTDCLLRTDPDLCCSLFYRWGRTLTETLLTI